ncbi:helix-turn-helix domain-containing protein [Paenibacillus roseus]|uniref:helix-turn-helix domain-containing protein n=1 Tax=Paenibacillus sp. GCM10012307 TaxID=3317343 RepID=UPI0036D2631A
MIAFTIFISAVPLLALGMYAFFQSTSAVQTKVNEANVFILQQSQSRVEQILKVIDQVSGRYAETPLVTEDVKKELRIEDFQEIDLLVKGLLGVQTYELGVRDVELHSLQHGWHIRNGGFYFGNNKSQEINDLKGNYSVGWIPETSSAFAGIRLVKMIPANAAEPKGYMSVRMSSGELVKLLAGGFATGETMILDDKMNVIVHSGGKLTGQNIASEGWIQDMQQAGRQQGYLNSVVLGEPSSVVYNQSRYNNWTYVSVIPLGESTKESALIGWATFTACLALVLIAALLSYWGSRRMYFPLRRLLEFTVRTGKPSGASGVVRDEFQRISTHLAFLHQSNELLEDRMKIQSVQLVDYFMLKLLQGELLSGELAEKMQQFQIPQWHKHAVLLMQIDTLDQTRYEAKEQDLLLFAINNIASELIPPPQRIHAMPVGNYQVTLVGSDADTHGELLAELSVLAESVQKAVDEYLGLKISAGISRPYDEMYATPQAFLEAKEALQYRIRLGEKAILHLDDLKPQQTASHYYPHHLASELVHSIAFLDAVRAEELLRKFIQEVLRVETNPRLYRVSFAMLLTDLARAVYETGDTDELFARDQLNKYEQLFGLKTPQEIEAWFRTGMIEPMIALARKRHDSSGKRISCSVRELIHTYYDSDLTLEQCAARLHYSTHYVRRMFRKETGLSFSEYLASYRHEKAKGWLSGTNMKITEIAERLQYTNAQNFIRQFRKLEGMTPGQYREQKLAEM